METLLKYLAGLLPVIESHWIASLLVLIALAGFGIYSIMSKHFMWFAENWFKPKRQQQHFEKTVAVGQQLQDALNRTLGATDATRVTLWEFHNGVENLGGVPFVSARLTYAACGHGIAITPQLMTQSTPLSAFADFTTMIWENPQNPKAVKKDVRDIKHPLMRSMYVQNGSQLAYAAPVCDIYGNAVGMVCIGYNDREHTKEDFEILHKLNNLSAEICGLQLLIKGKPRIFPFNRT